MTISNISSAPLQPAIARPTELAHEVLDVDLTGRDWAPVPAFGTFAQERLSTELVQVLRVWAARMRPGMWRNFRGETYPAVAGAAARPLRR